MVTKDKDLHIHPLPFLRELQPDGFVPPWVGTVSLGTSESMW